MGPVFVQILKGAGGPAGEVGLESEKELSHRLVCKCGPCSTYYNLLECGLKNFGKTFFFFSFFAFVLWPLFCKNAAAECWNMGDQLRGFHDVLLVTHVQRLEDLTQVAGFVPVGVGQT